MIDTKALRQKILDMAIRGLLVPQDPTDEPASTLLEKIRAEKQRLIKEGKIKKDKSDSVIYKGDDNRYYEKIGKNPPKCIDEELPFEIPSSWEWVRLPHIATSELGKTLNKGTDEGELVPYLCSINVYWDGINIDTVKTARFNQTELKKYKLEKGDLLICEGGEAGRATVWNGSTTMYYQNALHCVRFQNNIYSIFYKFVIEAYYYSGILAKHCTGVTIKHLVGSALNSIYFPLPSIMTQQRIVECIEGLFTQLDVIENNQAKLQQLYNDLKKKTLDLAICGKLVPQDPNDEPASELLKRIRAEKKAQLGKKYVDSYIYKGDDNCYYEHIDGTPKDLTIEVPFELPCEWAWCKLGDITFVTKLAGFEYTEHIAPNLRQNGIPLFKGKNIQNSNIIYEFEGYIPEQISNMLERSQITKKCILTPYVGSIGNIGIHNKNGKYHLGSNVGKIELLYPNLTTEEFIVFYLKSTFGYEELTKHKKATAQESISIEAIRDVYLPIPPFIEQQRIANKINEIFSKL